MVYFKTREAAEKEASRLISEIRQFGNSAITPADRNWLAFLKQSLGSLDVLPEVVAFWKSHGVGSIQPIEISVAVKSYLGVYSSTVRSRTLGDARYRLGSLTSAFGGRLMHTITTADLERWQRSFSGHSAYNMRKFAVPFFAYALRQRWIAVNPWQTIPKPSMPREKKQIYSPDDLRALLTTAWKTLECRWLVNYVALEAYGFVRTAELVIEHDNDEVLTWLDFDWSNRRIIIRDSVGKQTRRRSGNQRIIPISDVLRSWLRPPNLDEPARSKKLRVVPVKQSVFLRNVAALHKASGVAHIHNGLRRSAISYRLAEDQALGIGALSRIAGNSEATIRKHYLEHLLPEQGRLWQQANPLYPCCS
jgi:integrase